jgi:bifunctional DNA-binding transcriptional regulator/antitoxin component of YhaV-PrlF toxin-antitoxin module
VHDHTVLTALDWHTGQRIDITTVHDTIIVHAAPTGLHTVGARGDLTLPAAARALSGIPADSPVVLAAIPSENLLLVHPLATVACLLCTHYATMDDHHAD